jgi:acyl-CoA thioesterase-1
MSCCRTGGLLWLLVSILPALAQTSPSEQEPVFRDIPDTPGLPRVLLIGDSISMGYTVPVRELLAGKANVHRVPDNAGPTIYGLPRLDEWLGSGDWSVIHFNFGLHDLKQQDGGHQVEVSQYGTNLRRIVDRLRRTHAHLIWASTTPVPPGRLSPPRKTDDVPIYNAAAALIMAENGVEVNDLYSLVLPHLAEWQLPQNVHFKPEGYEALASQVAARIERALPGAK